MLSIPQTLPLESLNRRCNIEIRKSPSFYIDFNSFYSPFTSETTIVFPFFYTPEEEHPFELRAKEALVHFIQITTEPAGSLPGSLFNCDREKFIFSPSRRCPQSRGSICFPRVTSPLRNALRGSVPRAGRRLFFNVPSFDCRRREMNQLHKLNSVQETHRERCAAMFQLRRGTLSPGISSNFNPAVRHNSPRVQPPSFDALSRLSLH